MVCCVSIFAQTVNQHIVKPGETFESIARKYGVTVEELKLANKATQQYPYAGVALVIPQKAKSENPSVENAMEHVASQVPDSDEQVLSPSDSNVSISSPSEKKHHDEDESSFVWGFAYMAGTFDDVKTSGHYGIMIETYDIKGSGLGFGGIVGSLNFGLVDSDFASDLIQLGPNYSFLLGGSNNSRLIIPFYINYSFFGDKYKELTGKSDAWGWSVNPKISFGCIQAGLLFLGGFEGSSVSTGFSAALAF